MQNVFDGIVNEVFESLQVDDKIIETICLSIEDEFLKERVENCKGLVYETKWLCLSSHWSSFDYDLIKIVIKTCVPELDEKMTSYREKFKKCTLETFVNSFKMDTLEKIDSEEVLAIKLKPSGGKMEYIKKEVCKSLKNAMNINILRLQKLQKIEDCFLLTFRASFQDSQLTLDKLKEKHIAKLASCVTEVRLKNSCLYGLDGTFIECL